MFAFRNALPACDFDIAPQVDSGVMPREEVTGIMEEGEKWKEKGGWTFEGREGEM